MFGFEPFEFVIFARQLGLALVGASALWGLVFSVARKHDHAGERCLVYKWVAEKLFIPLYVGMALSILGWLVLYFMTPALAHEGIVLESAVTGFLDGVMLTTPLYIFWVFFTLAILILHKTQRTFIDDHLSVIFSVQLAIAIILASFPVWLGEFSRDQWFFIGHNVHSIFTLGTVLVLDFLFLTSRHSTILKQHIYPYFPTVSKVVWLGLGLDFLSAALVFDSAIDLSPKFFFMQTVLGILIINGILLAGPITRRLLTVVTEGGKEMSKGFVVWANIAGVISVASWSTLTLVDSFASITLGYRELIVAYLGLIILLIVGHSILDWWQKNNPSTISGHVLR